MGALQFTPFMPRETKSEPRPYGHPLAQNIKLLLIGDSAVGKTSLLSRYAEDVWTPEFVSTIGIDFKTRKMQIEGQSVKIQIWDTAGQERFRTITQAYYRGAMGIFVCFDLCDDISFKHVRHWMANIKTHSNQQVFTVLVGTKCDKDNKRMVNTEEGQALADEFDMPYFETSAKGDVNVKETFDLMVHTVFERMNGRGQVHEPQRGMSLSDSRTLSFNPEPTPIRVGCWQQLMSSFRRNG